MPLSRRHSNSKTRTSRTRSGVRSRTGTRTGTGTRKSSLIHSPYPNVNKMMSHKMKSYLPKKVYDLANKLLSGKNTKSNLQSVIKIYNELPSEIKATIDKIYFSTDLPLNDVINNSNLYMIKRLMFRGHNRDKIQEYFPYLFVEVGNIDVLQKSTRTLSYSRQNGGAITLNKFIIFVTFVISMIGIISNEEMRNLVIMVFNIFINSVTAYINYGSDNSIMDVIPYDTEHNDYPYLSIFIDILNAILNGL
jgi:hypothetical protein